MKRLLASQTGPGRSALRPAVVLILFLAGCTPSAPPSVTIPPPTTSAMPATPVTSVTPIDTTNWIVYKSKQYGFRIKHPPGWTVIPATHDWTLEADAEDWAGAGSEGFSAPVSLYVTVWSTPAKDTPETLEGVAAWVEQYCKLAGTTCTGLDRSVPLCSQTDCHPGLLVTVDREYVEAFFTGGKHKGQMVGVTVGRSEGHETVAKYGGARRLLEGFLAGMDVCPARPDQTPPDCPE